MKQKHLLQAGAVAAALLSVQTTQANSLWASDSGNGTSSTLFELDPLTGAVLDSIPGPGVFSDALSFANDGKSIYVLDSSTNSDVYQIDLNGAVLNSYSIPLDAEGLTILADNSLWIGGGVSGVIRNVNPVNGALISQFPVANQIFGMASNGTDTLYGIRINGVIDAYALDGTLLGSTPTSVSGTTLGLAYTGDGFYIASVGSRITKIDLAGNTLFSFQGPGSFTEGLDFPEGVQVPPPPVPDAGSTAALLALGAAALGSLRVGRKS